MYQTILWILFTIIIHFIIIYSFSSLSITFSTSYWVCHDGGKILAYLFYSFTSSITILLTQKTIKKKEMGFREVPPASFHHYISFLSLPWWWQIIWSCPLIPSTLNIVILKTHKYPHVKALVSPFKTTSFIASKAPSTKYEKPCRFHYGRKKEKIECMNALSKNCPWTSF